MVVDLVGDRVTESEFARQARDGGLADDGELRSMAAAWREWGEHPDGWLVILNGEVLATRGSRAGAAPQG